MAGSGFKRTAEMLPELFTTLSGNGKKIFTVGEVQVLIQ